MAKRSTTPQQPKDRHLDVPAEANRDKHMNYLAAANNENTTGEGRGKKKGFFKKIFGSGEKKQSPRGTHAPGFKKLPDDPRNLPTENTSMAANTIKKDNDQGKDQKG